MDNTKLRQNYDRLYTERKTLDSTLEVIRQFFVPFRGEFFRDLKTEHQIEWRDMRQVFDTTGISAADRLSANVQAALTNSAMKWFRFMFRDDRVNKIHVARTWLEECEDRIYQELDDSNFDVEASEFYLDAVSFGTAIISEEAESEIEWKGLDFSAIPLVDCYFEEGAKGQIIRFYRRYEWTALQIYDKFGEKGTPKEIKDRKDEAAEEKHKVVFCVYQRLGKEGADTSTILSANERPYGYKYILHADAQTLGEEGGYYEMPAFIARWRKVSGSKWGFGPAHIALSDALTLNQITSDTLEALGKVIDPAILTTQRGLLSDLDLRRSGVTVVRDVKGVVPFESKARFDVGELKTERLQAAIRSAFYVDQLELKESPAMTATEVNARADMVLKLMGPTSGRMKTDFLDPLLKRTFRIMMRAGQLPPPPQAVIEADAELDIEFTGPLPRAQRQDMVMAVNNWVGGLAQMAEVFPGVMDIPDADAIARELASLAGVPTRMTRDEKVVAAEREERSKKQAASEQLSLMTQGGEAAQSVGAGAEAMEGVDLEGAVKGMTEQ